MCYVFMICLILRLFPKLSIFLSDSLFFTLAVPLKLPKAIPFSFSFFPLGIFKASICVNNSSLALLSSLMVIFEFSNSYNFSRDISSIWFFKDSVYNFICCSEPIFDLTAFSALCSCSSSRP